MNLSDITGGIKQAVCVVSVKDASASVGASDTHGGCVRHSHQPTADAVNGRGSGPHSLPNQRSCHEPHLYT